MQKPALPLKPFSLKLPRWLVPFRERQSCVRRVALSQPVGVDGCVRVE